jgi:O-antigen ligase
MKLINIIKREHLQLLLAAFILLTVSVFFIAQPFHRSTVISCATILWVVGLACLPHYWRNKKYEKQELILYANGAIAFFICLTSWLNSPYFDGSFKTIEPDSRFLLFPLTVIAIRYSGLTFQHLALALFFGATAYVWISFSSASQRVNGDENAVTFGNGAMLLFVVSACLVFFEKRIGLKILLILAAAGYFYASYRSGTRGSFLSLIPLSLLLLYFLKGKQRFVAILFMIIFAAAFSQTHIANKLINASKNLSSVIESSNYRSSTGQRLAMWEASWCFNQESILLGKGPHQFKEAIKDPSRECKLNFSRHFSQAHSFYFNSLATVGFLGLGAMLTFFLMLAKYSYSLPLIARVTIPATLITFLTYSITVDLLFHRYMADKHLTLLAILLGISLSYKSNKQAKTALSQP